ncbi:MAG: hypothetical protein ACRDZ1_05685 [Acidimicrobiia bacterium]
MRLRLVAALIAVAAAVAGPAGAAAGGDGDQEQPPAPGSDLSVGVPPDPVIVNRGETATQLVRVSNRGKAELSVEFHQRAISLGDDGAVRILDHPDPVWEQRVKLPSGVQVIPAEGYQEYDVELSVPDNAAPDVYLVGFLVTPVVSAPGRVRVINEIGSFLTIDVPGKRDWRLEADLDLPTFVLGSQASGEIDVRNIGRSSLQFWGDITKRISPWGVVDQDRIDPKLYLPAGKERAVPISASPRWGIGIVNVPVRVSYPSGTNGATSNEILITKRVIVIHPLWVVALGLLLLGLVVYIWRRLRRRRRARKPPARRRPGKGRRATKPNPKSRPPERIEWRAPEPVSTR